MPGINLMDFTRKDRIVADQRDRLVRLVHDVLAFHTDKYPKHSSFVYSPANYLDASLSDDGISMRLTDGFDFILVIDGESNETTRAHKNKIRESIKRQAAPILNTTQEKVAVRYRLHDSSFG